jgi:tellurite resistance protein
MLAPTENVPQVLKPDDVTPPQRGGVAQATVPGFRKRDQRVSPFRLGAVRARSSPASDSLRAVATDPGGAPAHRTRPLLLGLYSMPLGLAGLCGGWAAATGTLGASSWPGEVLYGLSAALWLALTAIYLWQVFRDEGSFSADLKDPATGPLTSFIPIVAILLSAHYSQYSLTAGRYVCVLAIVSLMILAARLFVHWVTAGTSTLTVHPGYFIPLVAGAFVSSIGFSSVHAHEEALAAFGVGIFFWPVLAAIVLTRLMTAGPIPAPIIPSLSAFLATAATANVAWIVCHPGPVGQVQSVLTGVLVMMIFIQMAFLVEYRRLPFSVSFWVFTFPIAVTANYAIRCLAASRFTHWELYAWTGLGLASTFVAVIALRTIATVRTDFRRRIPGPGASAPS